ncbi:MAG: hypothetical protein ACUVQ5_06550, partial [Candidatus Methanomethylicaceae archaeon]
ESARCYEKAASWLKFLGQDRDARKHLRMAAEKYLQAAEKFKKENAPATIYDMACSDAVKCFKKIADLPSANKVLRDELDFLTKKFELNPESETSRALASLHESMGNDTKAVEYYSKSLDLRIREIRELHLEHVPILIHFYREVMLCSLKLVKMLRRLNELEKAQRYLNKALELLNEFEEFCKQHPESGYVDLADAHSIVAECLEEMGNANEARRYYSMAAEEYKREGHFTFAARSFWSAGKYSEASDCYLFEAVAGRLSYMECLELILCELRLCRWERALTFASLLMEKIKGKLKDDETKLLGEFTEALSAACNGILKENVKEVEESLRKFEDTRLRLKDEVYSEWIDGWLYSEFVERAIETLKHVLHHPRNA